MKGRNMIIGVASTETPTCKVYQAAFSVRGDAIDVAKDLALIFLGNVPFVFATFPVSAKQSDVNSKMEELWAKYRSLPGKR